MRPSWTQGIVMFYILTLFLQMFMTGEYTMDGDNNLGRLLDGYNPDTGQSEGILPGGLKSYTDAETGQSAPSFSSPSDILRLIKTVGSMGLLYHPALFQGNYVFFWFILCFPIAMAFWITLGLAIVRGVGSG